MAFALQPSCLNHKRKLCHSSTSFVFLALPFFALGRTVREKGSNVTSQ